MMRAALDIWIIAAVVCMGRGDHIEGHVHDHDHQHTELDTSARSLSLVTSAGQDFAYRLYRQLAAQTDSQGNNVFFSPISVTLALAALSVGARGQTHQQLFSGLGFNSSLLTQTDVDQAFNTLLNKTSREDVSAGTAVFVHNTFKTRPEFLDVLKKSYIADGFTIDFTKNTESADTINKYVGEKTSGKINKLVENLDPRTVMYLISYIYYKGKWESPFQPEDTMPGIFHVDEQKKVPVQMMNQVETFSFYHDDEISTSVLRLPFKNSNSMLLLLPDNDLAGLESNVSQSYITKWLKMMEPRETEVFVPKFSIKTLYSLKDVFSGMGMTDMFDKRAADFSGISDLQKVFVSEVVHQATLDVDETGATAAAATGITLVAESFHIVPVLRFDRPFMVLIIEPTTENILFMGKIINPTI